VVQVASEGYIEDGEMVIDEEQSRATDVNVA